MKQLLFTALFACWCLTSIFTSASAQQLPSNNVYIANPLNRTMKFSIVCDSGEKKESTKHQLKPQSSDMYKCSDLQSATLVRVVTGHKKPVLVKLEPKKRYEFYWNDEKSQWDVREVAPRT